VKNNIDYYPHFADAHEHWKFELLRAKYDWQGEGIFWALNNMVAKSEDTILDLNNKSKKTSLAIKFKMTPEEFENYLNYLHTDCELVIYKDGFITTDIVKNVYAEVQEKRKKERERIESWRQKQSSNNPVTCNNYPVQDIKVNESKVNKSKVYIPPTESEVIEYFRQNGYTDTSAIKAFKYYSEADWKDSNEKKVKNWKQKMQGVWFKDENKIPSQRSNATGGATI
jgi:hypothetical protein